MNLHWAIVDIRLRAAGHVLVLLAILLGYTPLDAQQNSPKELVAATELPRLFPIPNGYLGVAREGSLTRLTRYDTTFHEQAQNLYSGVLRPYDVAIVPGSTPSAFLLAAPMGKAALFRISTTSTPNLQPVWGSSLPPLTRILGVNDFDRNGTWEIATVGDSALAVIATDGIQRYVHRGEILDATLYSGTTPQYIVAQRVGSEIIVYWLDAMSGAILEQRRIPGSGEILMALGNYHNGRKLILVALGDIPQAYVFDPERRTFSGVQIPLPPGPVALVPCMADGEPVIGALYRTYPSPTVWPISEAGASFSIDYPLAGVFGSVALTEKYVALVASDSAALYTPEMELLMLVPSRGDSRAMLYEIDSVTALLSSGNGSIIITIESDPFGWLKRHWLLILFGLVLCSAAILIFRAVRRNRFGRAIYNNLVNVSDSSGVIVLSPSQKVRHINASARRHFGIDAYIPLERHISEYVPDNALKNILEPLRALFLTGSAFETKIDRTHDTVLTSLRFRGRPMYGRYGSSVGYLILIEDITKTLERERLVNWASVAHHIAHEMKTPLGTVRTTTEMLYDTLMADGMDADTLRSVRRVLRQATRLREIVEDLLTVARTESLQKVEADVALMLSSLADDFNEYLPGTIKLRVETVGENFRCQVDVSQITVAVRNLLDNARQAIGTRDGGRIRLRLEAERDRLLVIVDDNGIGMSKETLSKLFQPYYTEKEGGSGIGTVIIKRVIEAHGGSITVESEPGKGSKFIASIPRR